MLYCYGDCIQCYLASIFLATFVHLYPVLWPSGTTQWPAQERLYLQRKQPKSFSLPNGVTVYNSGMKSPLGNRITNIFYRAIAKRLALLRGVFKVLHTSTMRLSIFIRTSSAQHFFSQRQSTPIAPYTCAIHGQLELIFLSLPLSSTAFRFASSYQQPTISSVTTAQKCRNPATNWTTSAS